MEYRYKLFPITVLEENPEMRPVIAEVAKERLRKISNTSKEEEDKKTVLDR